MESKKKAIWSWMYSRSEEIMIVNLPIFAVLTYIDFKDGGIIDIALGIPGLALLLMCMFTCISRINRMKESLNYLEPIYENYIKQNKPTTSEVRLHHIVDVIKNYPQARTAKEIMSLCDQSLIGDISVKSFQNNFSEARSLLKTLNSEEAYKSSVPVRYWEKITSWFGNSHS